jgi:photosystem II stability/assembly factor-like uncharacterized protein
VTSIPLHSRAPLRHRVWALGAFWALLASAGEPPVPAAPSALAVKSLLTAVTASPEGTLLAVGERGHVMISRDGGGHWSQSVTPVDVLLTGACFLDNKTAVVVGHDETILVSQDSGIHWAVVRYAPETRQPLLDVACLPDGSVIAVGAYATVAHSTDRGAHFAVGELSAIPLPTRRKIARMDDDAELEQPHLNAIARAEDGALYIAGEAGHLYRSTDRGAHWVSLPSPYAGSLFTVLPLGGTALITAGLRGHLYRSDDQGEHWVAVPTAVDTLLDGAARLYPERVVVVGLAGVVLVSGDGGRSFQARRLEDRKGVAAVAMSPLGPVIVGESGAHRLTLAPGH